LKTRGDEDCLYLNIFRPDAHPTERLPVLVYFPHSNLFYGSGHIRDVAPDTLMEQDRVVLVVAQFRVGLFGFFTTGDRHAPGNLGLKDQQVALKWVYNYISYFSGDPHDVTVYGDATVQYQILQKEIREFVGFRKELNDRSPLTIHQSGNFNKKTVQRRGN
jgi:carboxylesterase type B